MTGLKAEELLALFLIEGSKSAVRLGLEKQMVYRGGLLYDPDKKKDVTHRYLDSLFDPVSWEDDEGTRMLAKAIKWRDGLYGKYWTNVKREGETQWGDIEHLKRHFILAKFPEVRMVNKATYDRARRRIHRS